MSRFNSQPEDEPNHDRWLVSYADFITLMFAFFTILYATSQHDAEKSKQFEESIKRFLIKAGGMGGAGDSQGQINQGQKLDSPIESPIQSFKPDKSPVAAKALDEAEAWIESQLTAEERDKYVIDVSSDDWGVRIIIDSAALFAKDQERFNEAAVPFVRKMSQMLAATKRKVLIEGHVGAEETGKFKSTWDFASARSVTLLRFMQLQQGLKPAMLASATLGDSRPLTASQSGKNSRVEVVILNGDLEI
jgi:chemotaxis protein MotB